MPHPAEAPQRIRVDDLEVDRLLHDFVAREAIPGTGVDAGHFWRGFASLVRRLSPRNAELLSKRNHLQSQIDAWHLTKPRPRIRSGALPRAFD